MVDKIVYIETEKDKYPMLFSLNVIESIQNEYGSYTKWGDLVSQNGGKEVDIKALKFGICEAINEGIEVENEENNSQRKLITLKQAGRILTEVGTQKIKEKLKEMIADGEDNGDEKN